MILSIIVAAAENDVIGKDNGLIWHLSSDLKRFKALTTGHTVIMGRRTFESVGKALPNRRNIVVSRRPGYRAEGAEVVASAEEALKKAGDEEEVFLIGGAMLYRTLWEQAGRLYLTRVHTEVAGDVVIPAVDTAYWQEIKREDFPADEKNEYPYSFIDYVRRQA